MKKFLILILILTHFTASNAQDSFFGFSAGLSFSFGNKVNRIGVSGAAYYTYAFAQVNAKINWYYNFQSLGTKHKASELQLGAGAEFGFGKRDTLRNNFIGLAENNLLQKNSVGYSYIRYWDNNSTTQSTGILDLNFGPVKLATENDLFAAGKGWRDRYRTGAFLISYQYLDTRFAINSTFWTGDYTGCDNIYGSSYPARFGYRTSEKGHYTNFSLGLLSAQITTILPSVPFSQVAQMNIGIDSEKIRNGLQNKIIHDQPFFPKKWIKREPAHLPMIATDGGQYLFQENQEIRPTSFYFNIGMNSGMFY